MTAALRAGVVAEAMTWLGTPYHHQGFLKGGGVDCAFFLAQVFEAKGLIPPVDPRPYPSDWAHHRGVERFKGWVEMFATQLPPGALPLPGDVVLYKFGRCFSHGAIVMSWPTIIHAVQRVGKVTVDDSEQGEFAGDQRPRLFYTLGAYA